ncbi:DUF2092 domain-containing protein [Arthrobacter sp. CJ23]|uniref:LolA family protein n=1 Tax=Arthrobacter sp. CJ23 TaxID=2972479 RepID=UPI0028526680|nr:DUF2092 domain-containing protein [Arthrobacter sp. CJ23]
MRTWQHWLPAALVPLGLAAATLAASLQAGAAVTLPEKSTAEILAMIGTSDVRALSGTLEQNSELGLPELPRTGPTAVPGAASVLELLSGSHTARVYLDSPDKARLQILDQLAERDVVLNGSELWLYNSADNSAAHAQLPAAKLPAAGLPESRIPRPAGPLPSRPAMPIPEQLAQHFLAAVEPSTEVTVGQPSRVAGRSAYHLVLNPRSTETLVESVAIDVDSETGLPLGVELRARGQAEPAFSLAFTELSLAVPDAGLFSFVPPPGATVEELAAPAKPAVPPTPGTKPADPAVPPLPETPGGPAAGGVTVSGSGWDTVIGLPPGTVAFGADPLLAQATQAVPGGRAVSTALATALLLDDGRVYAGMVPLERLQSAAMTR